MTGVIRCPVCEAEGLFLKKFGEHHLYKCTSCESLFYSPFPAPHHDTHESPWESAKWYVERGANLLFYSEVIEYVRNLLANRFPDRQAGTTDVLEVGSSYGFLIDMAASLFHWNISGVDPSPCALQGAQELGIEIAHRRLEGGISYRQFDAIIGVQLIEHVPDPYGFVNELSNLVKKNGFVLLTTPDASGEDLGAEYSPGEHYIIFSKKGLEAILKRAGFNHCHFFSTKLHRGLAVVASKENFPLDPEGIAKNIGIERCKQMVLAYTEKKIRSNHLPKAPAIGLSFRRFELLVNEGRYTEAGASLDALEKLIGVKDHESPDTFMARHFTKMIAADHPEDYVVAGPGCFAPYLFYKGILSLNYSADPTLAGKCFEYAAHLFEREVRRFSLIQYEPWLAVARDHMRIAGKDVGRGSEDDADDVYKETRSVQAAPFIRGGILEFCSSVPLGRLCRIGVSGGNSFVFMFTSMEDNLSGASFDVLIRPYSERDPVELTLHVFEEYNPVVLRKTSHVIGFGSRTKLLRFTEPFRFEPIQDSRGKNYSLVLGIGKDAKRAGLLCSTLKGTLTVAGYRQHRNAQPIIIPYHCVAARFRRFFPDKESPLVSCLIVTYNSEGYIRHCLNSLATQDYPNIEVVVVDNHSDDRTVEIIRGEFDHVNLVVMEQNLEFCKGNNWGLTKCRGKFICVLNADVVLEQGAIRRFVEHMELSPHVAIVGSTIETKGSTTRYADTFIINGLISNNEKLLEGKRFSSAPCGAGFMIRRSVIDELGYLFDEGFISNWEDHDLGLRCWLHGHVVLHIPELGLYHSGGSAYGLADPRRESQVFRNMLLTYFKNFGKRLFLRAFLRTLTSCTRPYRILGVTRFLGCFWKYIPERAALQRKRKIDDSVLQVVTSGFLAILPENENKKGV